MMASLTESILEKAESHSRMLEICLAELSQLAEAVKTRSKIPVTGLRSFTKALKEHQDTLHTVPKGVGDFPDGEESTERLKKLNVKMENVTTELNFAYLKWNCIKRSQNVTAFNRTFMGMSRQERKKQISQLNLENPDKAKHISRIYRERARAAVDVVDWGREWLYSRLLRQDRLARSMTDCGWSWGDYELGDKVDPFEWEDVLLVKQVQRLVLAARANRCDYQIPRIRVVLPKVSRSNKDIAVFLEQVCNMDELVEIIIEDGDGLFMATPEPSLEKALENLTGNELDNITTTLNLDQTILIDLISDITHLRLEPNSTQSKSTREHIEHERRDEGAMVKELYPILEGRELLCTKEAANHFHEILGTVGTESEKARGRLLVPISAELNGETSSETLKGSAREQFNTMTKHPLPVKVQFPIIILSTEWSGTTISDAVQAGTLPTAAVPISQVSHFTDSKRSIYMFGWASGHTTLTSNKEIRGQFRTMVEAQRQGPADAALQGPRIWPLSVTRNLLAKVKKERRPKEERDSLKEDLRDDEDPGEPTIDAIDKDEIDGEEDER